MPTCPTCAQVFDSTHRFCPDDGQRLFEGAERPDDGAGRTGEVLNGRYRLLQRIGEGGMGEVYKAVHVELQRLFAVKFLLPKYAENQTIVDRFQREALATGGLKHPNIVGVTDFGQSEDGAAYLVMEWQDGETLDARLEREGPLEVDTALEWAAQVADGLAAAHAKGVIHRDIKPSNLFVARAHDGGERIVLLDFGIAKLLDAAEKLTRHGELWGTPDYASPEQMKGLPASGASDVFSLGMVLYEMLTGETPSDARWNRPEPPSARASGRTIPPSVDQIVLKCLAHEAVDRVASAQDLAQSLRDPRQSMLPDAVLPLRKPSTAAWLSAAAVLGVGVAGAIWWAGGSNAGEGTTQPEVETPATPSPDDPATSTPEPQDTGAAPSWEWDVETRRFRYEVTATPAPAHEGEPLHLLVQLVPREEASGEADQTKVTMEHYLQHQQVLEVLAPVKHGKVEVDFRPPKPGKYHVTIETLGANKRLDRARFDLCVGAMPGTPRSENVCPRMK